MSEDGEKAAVFRTTKVRTKLKGDSSWLQQQSGSQNERRDGKVRAKLKGDSSWLQQQNDPQAVAEEEKPWMAELRNCRQNGDGAQTSPVSSPTKSTQPLTKSEAERTPTSGFLIRGVFAKLDSTSSPPSNSFSGSTQVIKKPSESYKKIAPHTVKSSVGNQETQLSEEEQEKRREAASNVLKQSAARQRSYVLSAAKKFESQQDASEPSLNRTHQSFVATRVEIIDDENTGTAAPVASTPQPKPRKIVNTASVDQEPAASKKEATPEPVKEAPPLVPVAEKGQFENLKPGCTEVETPLPELSLESLQSADTGTKTEDSQLPGQTVEAMVELAPEIPTLIPHAAAPPTAASSEPESSAPVSAAPKSPTPSSPVPEPTTPESTAPASVAPQSPVPVSADTVSPVPPSPAPQSPPPVSDVAESPTPPSPVPELPARVSNTPESLAPAILMPEHPALVSITPESPTSTSPVPESTTLVSITPESPTSTSPVPESTTLVSITPKSPTSTTESKAGVSFVPVPPVSAVTETTERTELEPSLKLSSGDDTLVALSDTLISFDNSSSSFKNDEPTPVEREASPAEKHANHERAEETPTPELSNCVPVTEDLLAFTAGPEEPPEPVPPSPGRWSQDLLGNLSSEPGEASSTMDLLANDLIFISREAPGLNVEPEGEKQAANGTQSSTETITTTTETVIIVDKGGRMDPEPLNSNVKTTFIETSLADPFDPYPIGTTAPTSLADPLQPDSDISINSVSVTHTETKDPGPNTSSAAMEALADDIIPINTNTTRLSTRRSWARTWETGSTEQSPDTEAQDGDQKMFVMFERKSSENDSPWDRWTSPTVYTTTTAKEEEEEEEERPEDTQTETVTTITTIREIQSEPEPAMEHYGTYSRTLIEEDQRVETPPPEAKKPFVYVKEYINTTASSLHNMSNDYPYSSSTTYSSGSGSSACTYCGEPVGNDAKITIEHLNIDAHPHCFKCAVCSKPMGDLLDSMFIHGGKVNCESCYSRAFD